MAAPRLLTSVEQRTCTSLTEKLFGLLQTRKPQSIGRADRDDRLIAVQDLRERARAYVKGLCKTKKSYLSLSQWYCTVVRSITALDNASPTFAVSLNS
jgi:hypothetical protein